MLILGSKVWTKNIDLFNKVHILEPMKSHVYEPNISLISLMCVIFNYAEPQINLSGKSFPHCIKNDTI